MVSPTLFRVLVFVCFGFATALPQYDPAAGLQPPPFSGNAGDYAQGQFDPSAGLQPQPFSGNAGDYARAQYDPTTAAAGQPQVQAYPGNVGGFAQPNFSGGAVQGYPQPGAIQGAYPGGYGGAGYSGYGGYDPCCCYYRYGGCGGYQQQQPLCFQQPRYIPRPTPGPYIPYRPYVPPQTYVKYIYYPVYKYKYIERRVNYIPQIRCFVTGYTPQYSAVNFQQQQQQQQPQQPFIGSPQPAGCVEQTSCPQSEQNVVAGAGGIGAPAPVTAPVVG